MLAQAVAEIEKNYYGQTEIIISVDAILIKDSESTNSIDEDNLIDCLSTPPVLADMEVVWKSLLFFSNFD